MRLLNHCLEQLDHVLPELQSRLRSLPFTEREQKGSPVIQYFKESEATKLLIAKQYGGLDSSPQLAFDVQLALSSISPSLGIACGMHQFSVASLVALSKHGKGLESLLLEAICQNKMLVASAFSEGAIGKSILSSRFHAQKSEVGYVINGVKQPCSLAHDMDLLTASVNLAPKGEQVKLGIAMIAANSDGIEIEDFWQAPFFKASQTEKVILNDVAVHKSMMINLSEHHVYDAHITGFIWFELLTCATYFGILARLVQKLATLKRLPDRDKVNFNQKISACYLMFTAIATAMERPFTEDLMGDVLNARYLFQDVINEIATQCTALAGGLNFLKNNELLQLINACQALQFHPPAKYSMENSFLQWFNGQKLTMV